MSFLFRTEKNFSFIFTGAPGSGKTTTGNYLKNHGNCQLIKEAAQVVIESYQKKAQDHRKDMPNFQSKVNTLCAQNLEIQREGVSIFDRCTLDCIVFEKHYQPEIKSDTFNIAKDLCDHGMSDHVFLFCLSDNEKDYQSTASRTESYADAKKLQAKFSKEYEKAGFHVHTIPWMPLHERAQHVFQQMHQVLKLLSTRQPLANLYKIARGMNDEGGKIQQFLKANQIWSNLSVVLDRPFIDAINFDYLRAIKKQMNYQMKEEAIDTLNENQVNFGYALILSYYIVQGHKLTGKDDKEPLHLLLHSFRESDGDAHIKMFKDLLRCTCPELTIVDLDTDPLFAPEKYRCHLQEKNITLSFCKGKVDKDSKNNIYDVFNTSSFLQQADIILTFSVHVGLKPEWKPGAFCIPTKWTPINTDTMEVETRKCYFGDNHLARSIKEVVAQKNQQAIADRVNRLFQSRNPKKCAHKASLLKEEDFHPAQFLELGGHIFIPSQEKLSTFGVK